MKYAIKFGQYGWCRTLFKPHLTDRLSFALRHKPECLKYEDYPFIDFSRRRTFKEQIRLTSYQKIFGKSPKPRISPKNSS